MKPISDKLKKRMSEMDEKELDEIDMEAKSMMVRLLEIEDVQLFVECQKIVDRVKVLKID